MIKQQKVYKDKEVKITLWDLPKGKKLTLTEDMLNDMGYFDDASEDIDLFKLQEIFRCNVTIEEVSLASVHYDEKESNQ